jgi:ribonuclease HI
MVTTFKDHKSGEKPHFLLSVETAGDDNPSQWRFRLKGDDGLAQFDASDVEPGVSGERLDLLTIIRALESLDQPSRVTLTSCSRYIQQGVQYGVSEWRENRWQWEFFGYMVPVKHADLWRRMDHLLEVHSVECRQLRFDPPQSALSGPTTRPGRRPIRQGLSVVADVWLKYTGRIGRHWLGRCLKPSLLDMLQRLTNHRPASHPCPGSS